MQFLDAERGDGEGEKRGREKSGEKRGNVGGLKNIPAQHHFQIKHKTVGITILEKR